MIEKIVAIAVESTPSLSRDSGIRGRRASPACRTLVEIGGFSLSHPAPGDHARSSSPAAVEREG
ncbi:MULTISPECIES: hypothetical protein [unclassified Methylosinus]|uniref:hypothetical protein n=1 Tax=unclassified Methylosinus TaxID=2624500 RepID=UPI000A83DB4F|nr:MULTISPECIES: hypothetical protein [unclassified Methylosinus]